MCWNANNIKMKDPKNVPCMLLISFKLYLFSHICMTIIQSLTFVQMQTSWICYNDTQTTSWMHLCRNLFRKCRMFSQKWVSRCGKLYEYQEPPIKRQAKGGWNCLCTGFNSIHLWHQEERWVVFSIMKNKTYY